VPDDIPPGPGPPAGDGRVSAGASQPDQIRFQPAGRRAIAQRLPEAVTAAVLNKFCEAALSVDPRRVGNPLLGSLAGCPGARRGTYRIVYRIDDDTHTVHVLDVDQRSEIYHRPQA
jgi:mRNA interferase RelE/StbE